MAWPEPKSRIAEAQPVGAHLRIAIDKRNHAPRLLAEDEPRGLNAVAADVVHGAAARLNLVADVRRVDIEVAEVRIDRAQFADAAFVEKLAHAQPLRRAADHEGFADFDAGAGAHVEQRFGLGHGHAQGLFAEHVLAGFGCLRGPRDVELIGQRIVDGVDVWIGEQFLIRAVGRGNAEFRGRLAGLGQIARSNGGNGGEFALLHGGDHFFQADIGGAEHAETKLRRHNGMIPPNAAEDVRFMRG